MSANGPNDLSEEQKSEISHEIYEQLSGENLDIKDTEATYVDEDTHEVLEKCKICHRGKIQAVFAIQAFVKSCYFAFGGDCYGFIYLSENFPFCLYTSLYLMSCGFLSAGMTDDICSLYNLINYCHGSAVCQDVNHKPMCL